MNQVQTVPCETDQPLRVMFLITSMPVGGAETLLVNMVRRMDRNRVEPLLGCMKEKGVLGEALAAEIPVFDHLISHKFDVAVVGRLARLFQTEKVDAVITVGAGDKMFWGRLAARRAGVPVILSALHSTGWPDGVGRLNRMLTGITDGFIAVARDHARYQVEQERFPKSKVFMIPNGIDTNRFKFCVAARSNWRSRYDIPAEAPVVGIVAALRSEKNHSQFVEAAAKVLQSRPDSHFVIAGEGPERELIESKIAEHQIQSNFHLLGSVDDIPGVLSMVDVFSLTSHNEASPVSILEAMSCERPVVAPDVGSIHESVLEGETGFLVEAGNVDATADRWLRVIESSQLQQQMGSAGRQHVIANGSLASMTNGYMQLVEAIYANKQDRTRGRALKVLGSAIANTASSPTSSVG